jgi:hypothetical protein
MPKTPSAKTKAAHVYPRLGLPDTKATPAQYEASPNKAMGLSKAQISAAKKAIDAKNKKDPRWPNPKVDGKRVKGARGKRVTIAENPKPGEPKVTSNNIGPKVKQKWKDG